MSQQFIIKLNEQGPQGAQGERGETGATGNGINYIEKTSTSGIVDTYTIYYTNGNTSTFEVTNGNSIDTIEKTSTVGVVDTYTITMVDGSTHTFTVTNGSSISSIEKTSTVGLTDTYTITLTNGDTSTFTVTNGNGISSINKTATSGLTDTYTISFTNGSTMDFDIKNGKSIVSVTGPTTLGLVDTYTINFNDNTSSTFNVTNGNGITNIEKTGSTGLLDTYTISMSNGSYETFTVTNGEKGDKGDTGVGVVGITKTSTSGLEDTYTMSYTDGSSSTFVVTNGNGIEDIELLSTEGLTNNYRINFDNGTYFDYSLDNAKSIVSISKVMTSGLVDTYRIEFNDGSSFQFPVTNGNGVSGVTLLSWVGLDKTYRMTFTNGTYFDFTVSNGAEGQAEWGGISGVLSNQHDLQDALDLKADASQTHALKAYTDRGELLYDAEGLEDVQARAHSTFDLSKFTVAGNPVITDDGIASGFSSSNYLLVNGTGVDNTVGSWKITSAFMTNLTGNAQDLWCEKVSNQAQCYVRIDVSNKLRIHLMADDSTTIINYILGSTVLSDNTNYLIETIYNGTTYQVLLTNLSTGVTTTEASVTSAKKIRDMSTLLIGVRGVATPDNIFAGSIDLKQLSVTSDGIPVFSGNRTGIDTIKPNNYTVVGTPTISADGVASGFSASNKIDTGFKFKPNGRPWKQYIRFKTGNDFSAGQGLMGSYGTSDGTSIGFITEQAQIKGYVSSNGTSWNIFEGVILNTVTANTEYYLSFEWTGTQYIWKQFVNGNWIVLKTIDSTTPIYDVDTNIYIGLNRGSSDPFKGEIDLNSIKYEIDGNLVYQPCLKIPYTESKTGSKIANSIYRDRVNDMASQFGYASYYTLDEDNGNFTLPQVELYGLIGDKTIRDSYYNGVTYWELFSNRRLEQGGTCESGVEYTLPKPFADSNYVLTIPYSSKTATSFIPSATGDFIAKGMGLL